MLTFIHWTHYIWEDGFSMHLPFMTYDAIWIEYWLELVHNNSSDVKFFRPEFRPIMTGEYDAVCMNCREPLFSDNEDDKEIYCEKCKEEING